MNLHFQLWDQNPRITFAPPLRIYQGTSVRLPIKGVELRTWTFCFKRKWLAICLWRHTDLWNDEHGKPFGE